ncbi:MAG TPA: FmdB family zinc ribbon protein [Candidatus Kapabacteria bacterium]|nr:FmdB family zinc ribbon protein [Candidatus Kapabacteria bacterium]
MPNYDYRCDNCGFEQEIFQRISEDAITTCPNCGMETFQRVVTGGAGVLYKGEGWYVTDYSKKSSGGKETGSSTTSKSETKSESTSKPSSPPAGPKINP